MITLSRRWLVVPLSVVVLGAGLMIVMPVHAQESVAVSVTPPLIQLTIGPGETWSSSLKVVNSNPYDISYYTSVVDFEAKGEEGQGTFIPLVGGTSTAPNSYSLASWISLEHEPVLVVSGKSGVIPFSVTVPEDAEPGGHYAAILVGTQPGGVAISGPTVKVASYVSSLLFVRIRGTAAESGRIREFHTDESFYETAAADFVLRFENTGTMHLRPQGDIVISNMWGKERGRLVVNQNGNFGNVLPHSTRKFTFSWEGDASLMDVGRYSAVVTLAYGEDAKQNISATTYFWVVPAVPVGTAVGGFLLFTLLITWFIRRYIRRALALERERLGLKGQSLQAAIVPIATIETLIEPLREGVIDLRRTARASAIATTDVPRMTLGQLVVKYRVFVLFLVVIGFAVWIGIAYARPVLTGQGTFRISDVQIQEEAPTEKTGR